MKRFSFRHESSLRHALQSQRLAELEAARLRQQLEQSQAELARLDDYLDRLRQECLQGLSQPRQDTIAAQVALQALEVRIEQLREIVRAREQSWLQAREQLVELRKRVATFEQLREDHFRQYQLDSSRAAQVELNDWLLRGACGNAPPGDTTHA